MGGEIGAKSQPGKGSDFFFSATFGAAQPREARRPATPASLRGLRILVVDDSQNSREIMQGLLVGLDYPMRRTCARHWPRAIWTGPQGSPIR
jgi:two-component system sensor histidine kinase/response regulator